MDSCKCAKRIVVIYANVEKYRNKLPDCQVEDNCRSLQATYWLLKMKVCVIWLGGPIMLL